MCCFVGPGEDQVFMTIPRFKPGVPATLNTVITSENGRPLLLPYPEWSWHREGNCDGITSVFRVQVCLMCSTHKINIFLPPYGAAAPTRARVSSFSMRFPDHTQRRTRVGMTPLDEWSARRRDLYLTTHNTHIRQTSKPPVGFEPTISAGERPQTYALDRAATGYIFTFKKNSVALVRKRTIPTERPPPVGEVSANFCG